MKKTVFTFATLLLCVFVSGQKKGTSDLSVNVGGLTSADIAKFTSQIIVTGISAGYETFDNQQTTPALGVTYKYAVKDNWLMSGDGIYQSFKDDILLNNVSSGSVTNSFYTLGVGTEYHYIHSSWFQMYSGLSVAYSMQVSKYTGSSNDIEDGNGGSFNFQVNAAGFRVGKSLAAFAELGFGYKGVLNLGLSYQF